eukprot:7912196-Karenia_brevis.AAC.1
MKDVEMQAFRMAVGSVEVVGKRGGAVCEAGSTEGRVGFEWEQCEGGFDKYLRSIEGGGDWGRVIYLGWRVVELDERDGR